MVRLRVSWPFSLSSAPAVGNPCRPLQPESVSLNPKPACNFSMPKAAAFISLRTSAAPSAQRPALFIDERLAAALMRAAHLLDLGCRLRPDRPRGLACRGRD